MPAVPPAPGVVVGRDERAVPDDAHRVPIESELDLHAFAPADAASVVDEYIRAAHEAGLTRLRIVHGRGRGVRRGLVQAALDRHPLVDTFWDDHDSHLGATWVALRLRSHGDDPR
jgi:DNA-nicking Smr family endonuclease